MMLVDATVMAIVMTMVTTMVMAMVMAHTAYVIFKGFSNSSEEHDDE